MAGATVNIERAAAQALAKKGVRVVLLGRKPDKLKSKADLIRTALSCADNCHQQVDIEILAIDFSDMESVRASASEVLQRFPTINALILSDGTMIQNGPNILPSGHEVMFATSISF